MELREEFLKAYHTKAAQRAVGTTAPPAPSLELTEALGISVINQKGGCGKTTTAINLSAYLAEMGFSVLLVDLDPQAHVTLGLGLQGDALEWTIYHLLMRRDLAVTRVLQTTHHRNLKLLPANGLLAAAQVELLHQPNRDQVLKNRLEELKNLFHFIFIDSPPTLNLLTLNALTAADRLIIPVQTQYYSLDGMRELFKTIELVRENSNPNLEILGILPTLYDGRTKMNRAMLKALQEYFHDRIFETIIHLNSALAECAMVGQPVNRYAPASRGAEDYRRLAEEVIYRVKQPDRSLAGTEETV